MFDELRYLLLQVRDDGDPMRGHEVRCFAEALLCRPEQIHVFDLLTRCPTVREMNEADIVLLGGSGDYSVASGGPWLEAALEAMRELHEFSKPTFASCWGFQAMARALGGRVVTDLTRAEVGTHRVTLTDEGRTDPVLGPLASGDGDRTFLAQMGHQDIVERLPPGTIRLASTDRVRNQAFRIRDKPIYCTQFHPELTRRTLLDRLFQYPTYVHKIMGIPLEQFISDWCAETPRASQILPRFVRHVMNG
ncbi:MAG: type 1 glutamine amidotransferase [Planctomycetota bacterium]|jgi:GMP synthase (glutamine-hydrolysing)